MLAVAKRYMRNTEDAEDITQQSMISAVAALDKFRGDCSLKTWLKTIVTNTTRNYIRGRREFVNIDTLEIEAPPDNSLPKDEREFLRKEIEKLPLRQQAVARMHIYEHKSFKEIAAETGNAYDTIKANYRHVLKKLGVI